MPALTGQPRSPTALQRQRRLEEADAEDSSQPCFDPGHRFVQVVPDGLLGGGWLTLPPGPGAGEHQGRRQQRRAARG